MEKETKELIEKILHEIVEDIINKFDKKELKNEIGLLSGKAGISLFMFYYARYFKNERCERYAQKILEDTFDNINNGSLLPTYCSGIAGVCWTIIHLVENNFIEKENLEVLNDFDEFLFKAMKNYIENEDFDFLHGATGIALYFTKRVETNKNVTEYLEFYVKNLKDYAIFDEEKKTAKIISTVLDENENPKKVYNLSMSHGMSSIIIILCKIHDLTDDKSDCYKLICGMTNYILSCEKPLNPVTFSRYPSYIGLDEKNNANYSRLAWCYGDLNNAYAFLNASILCNSDLLKLKAKEIFSQLKTRKDIQVQSIRDAGLCHGAAGIALVCSNLTHHYEPEVYRELEKYWLQVVLDFYNEKSGLEGFQMATKDGFKYEISLLSGITGIGHYFVSELNDDSAIPLEKILLLN